MEYPAINTGVVGQHPLDYLDHVQSLHHILTGSFRSLGLALLVFSPINRSLRLVQHIPPPLDSPGPYQYIGLNSIKDRAYTTSWAWPPKLISWKVNNIGNNADGLEDAVPQYNDRNWSVSVLNSVPITAVSSYTVVPPPYTHIYSVGGPTGEVHRVESSTGGFGEKIQQVVFVPPSDLDSADKTRVALRYGSHGIEFSSALSRAFVPVLGTDTIEMYTRDPESGELTKIFSSPSPRGVGAHDGPRHVKVHPNGRILYSVTEHTNYIDVYSIAPDSLNYTRTVSLLPEELRPSSSSFRGDTLLLTPPTQQHPAPVALFATTRGGKEDTHGWLTIVKLDIEGYPATDPQGNPITERYEMPTSGGKAHALDLLTKEKGNGAWVLLTDDSDAAAVRSNHKGGAVRVLEWDGWGSESGLREVVSWPSVKDSVEEGDELWFNGGSHAVWLD